MNSNAFGRALDRARLARLREELHHLLDDLAAARGDDGYTQHHRFQLEREHARLQREVERLEAELVEQKGQVEP